MTMNVLVCCETSCLESLHTYSSDDGDLQTQLQNQTQRLLVQFLCIVMGFFQQQGR